MQSIFKQNVVTNVSRIDPSTWATCHGMNTKQTTLHRNEKNKQTNKQKKKKTNKQTQKQNKTKKT